ncbi:hypothetical protein SASPL_151442 [Salvia splendens]|uniref:Mitochondrial chaperone BCS1 n=1 Tax=Salvia splendens TaxID=180675 RepID=A0A8X8Z2P0_SALSN|nr:hypothetical protein SASPL_151442 [Salvia splendens]
MIRRNCPTQLRRYIEKLTERLSGFLNPDIQAVMTNKNKVMLSMDEYDGRVQRSRGEMDLREGSFPGQRGLVLPGARAEVLQAQVRQVLQEDDDGGLPAACLSLREGERFGSRTGSGGSTRMASLPPGAILCLSIQPSSRLWQWSREKEEIVEDLLTFIKSKDYYARIGKVWKRGYLLYGPPGTGKSTMITAMANLLSYDVYDLELTSVKDNSELRKLLINTTAKSIIVIEDIDCSLNLTGQREKKEEKPAGEKPGKVEKKTTPCKEKTEKEESDSKVTLSGLLNFIDGLWSALLAKNYLELEAHPLFQSIEELIQEVQTSPADVAENLMPKSAKDDPEQSLRNLICILEETKNSKCTEVKDAEINHNATAI